MGNTVGGNLLLTEAAGSMLYSGVFLHGIGHMYKYNISLISSHESTRSIVLQCGVPRIIVTKSDLIFT